MTVKYKRLADHLKEEIARLASEGTLRLPTEMELMQQYGVSRQTVRQALSVLQSDGLIEKRRGSGTYIAPSAGSGASPRTIAVLAPHIDDPAFQRDLLDAQAVFSGAGYMPRVFSTKNRISDERAILQSLLDSPACGILARGTRSALPNPNLDLYRRLMERGTAVLFVGDGCRELPGAPCVRFDDYAGAYQLTQHLIQQRHTRIAGIFRCDSVSGHERFRGCACALRDSALPFDDSRFFWYDAGQSDPSSGAPAAQLLQPFIRTQLPGCSAVVCQNDEIACFLIRELQRLHIRVPQQISVVGFGDTYFSEISPVRVTTLSPGDVRLWRHAAAGLLLLIDRRPFPCAPFSWTLVKKDSDGPAV